LCGEVRFNFLFSLLFVRWVIHSQAMIVPFCLQLSFATMKNISIIGIGWLGKQMAMRLKALGYGVKGSVTQAEKCALLNQEGIETFVIDFALDSEHWNQHPLQQADVVIVTVPPRKAIGEEQSIHLHTAIARFVAASSAQYFMYCSSTSVYPDTEATLAEADADSSSHIFHLEQVYSEYLKPLAILRFGGLMGKGRHPIKFISGKKNIEKPNAVVNMTHADDAVNAIVQLLTTMPHGVFNVVNTHHPTRQQFYTAAAESAGMDAPQFDMNDERMGKIISSDKLLATLPEGFQFAPIA
jgi:nucleoside-diphosphate-sugar epimerase